MPEAHGERAALTDIAKHYEATGESVAIDLTVFGPGYAMVRADVSPVEARITEIRQCYPFVRFPGCRNARRAMA